MGQMLCFLAAIAAVLALVGFTAGLILMSLLRIYERLSEKATLLLKCLTLGPPLFLALIGLFTSLQFLPESIILYVFSGLLAGLGWKLFPSHLDGSLIKKPIGEGLLVAAALPFMVVGLVGVSGAVGAGTYSFDIRNHTDQEIVLKEIQVNGKMISTDEHRLPGQSDRGTVLKADFWRKPSKIRLFVYDAKLGKDIWWEVKLPNYPKHSVCPFDIVYEADGFQYEDNPCG